jgi:hypothetical protein
MEERRHFPRTKCFKGATIKSPSTQALACLVRNVSAEGAGLELSYSAILPAAFDLCFDTGQQMQRCRVVWRTARAAGVSFTPQA